jgi:hypothetical protein
MTQFLNIPFTMSVVVAFMASSFYLWKSLRDDFPEEDLIALITLIVAGALVGTIAGEGFMGGRLSIWGAPIGALGMFIWYIRRKKWNGWDMVDHLGFVILVSGVSIGIGCKFSGYWVGEYIGKSQYIHPVGLYFALLSLMGILVGRWIKSHYRGWNWYRSGWVGFAGLVCVLWFSLGYLVVAQLTRNQLYWGPITVNGWLSIVVIAVSVYLIYRRSGRFLREDLIWLRKILQK